MRRVCVLDVHAVVPNRFSEPVISVIKSGRQVLCKIVSRHRQRRVGPLRTPYSPQIPLRAYCLISQRAGVFLIS